MEKILKVQSTRPTGFKRLGPITTLRCVVDTKGEITPVSTVAIRGFADRWCALDRVFVTGWAGRCGVLFASYR